MLKSAPYSKSHLTTIAGPFQQATYRGVWPYVFLAFTSTPASKYPMTKGGVSERTAFRGAGRTSWMRLLPTVFISSEYEAQASGGGQSSLLLWVVGLWLLVCFILWRGETGERGFQGRLTGRPLFEIGMNVTQTKSFRLICLHLVRSGSVLLQTYSVSEWWRNFDPQISHDIRRKSSYRLLHPI